MITSNWYKSMSEKSYQAGWTSLRSMSLTIPT
jgi:hypothetical protein